MALSVEVPISVDLDDLERRVLQFGLATERLHRLEVIHAHDRELISKLFACIGRLTEREFELKQALRRVADGHGDPVVVAKGALR